MPLPRVIVRIKRSFIHRYSRELSMAHWSATCLSSESSDTNLSLLVDCNSSRYLFNCGEGTTRTLLQRKKGFRKFTTLFTTGIDTDRSSGLAGLIMTIADSGGSKLDVFGPLGLNHYLASTRLYTMRESLTLNSHEIMTSSTPPVYTDENISVFAIPIFPDHEETPSLNSSQQSSLKRKYEIDSTPPADPSKRKKLDTDCLDSTPCSIDRVSSGTSSSSLWDSVAVCPSNLVGAEAHLWRRLVIQHMFPGKSVAETHGDTAVTPSRLLLEHEPIGRKDTFTMKQLNKTIPRMTRQPCALSYVVLGAPRRGKFDTAKAEALGLKNGPLRGKLAKGENIVTADGRLITPDMVLGPAPRQNAMMIVDCPSTDYIPGLVHSTAFIRFQRGGEYPVHCMFHLVGSKVLDDVRYFQWLETFGDKVHHLVAGPDITPDRITFTSSAYAQLRLSHLDSKIFQVPMSAAASAKMKRGLITGSMEMTRHNHFVSMDPAMAPVLPHEDDGIDLFHPAVRKGGYNDISSILKPKTIEMFKQARQLVARECENVNPQPGDDVTVIPLGTSSAMPSKYRNVSSIIVQVPGSGNILLDCGEGTMGQLRRHFGERADSVLRDLRCIFISHIHGDHHMGLAKLLSQRRKLDPCCDSPVYLIANQTTSMCLLEYNDLEDLGLNDPTAGVLVINSEHVHWRQRSRLAPDRPPSGADSIREQVQRSQFALRDLLSCLNLTSISTVDVWHKGRCYGIVLKHHDDWSIVYSGDTRPSDNLVSAGRNATLLIHEATMGEDQVEIAAAKAHSTIGQAIDVAKRMKAKNVLLTHFSNRFPKTPQVKTAPTEASDPIVAVAFDHVTVRIGDLWKLNRYLPAIKQSFIDSEDLEDEAALAGDIL